RGGGLRQQSKWGVADATHGAYRRWVHGLKSMATIGCRYRDTRMSRAAHLPGSGCGGTICELISPGFRPHICFGHHLQLLLHQLCDCGQS
ncbi:MAG: hypothetical protein ACREIC_12990, partial [Limisphaerales bacterium]